MKKRFFAFVLYHPTLFLLDRESHYHFWPCSVMSEIGYEVEIVAFWDGIRIEDDPNFDPRFTVKYVHSTIEALWYAWKNRDAVWYINTFVLPSLLMGIVTKKSIFFGHEQVFASEYSPFYRLKRMIIKCCYPFFTKIRVINEHDKNWLSKEGFKNKWIVIPLVISEKNRKSTISPEPNILMLGHIVFPKKDPETMIHALSRVIEKYPYTKIYQVGDNVSSRNDEGKTFEEILRSQWIRENFILYGKRKESLRELDLPTSIYINSSFQEGQCIAVYDGALLGNALCLPDISSFRGILDGNYKTHSVYDYEKLAENIIWYIEHPEEREYHIRENRKWIHDHHNYEFIQKRIQEEFDLI